MHLIQTHIKQAAQTTQGTNEGNDTEWSFGLLVPRALAGRPYTVLKEKGLRATPSLKRSQGASGFPDLTRPVAEGAAIYGARLLSGEPTYLDTLPQLWTYAQDRGKLGLGRTPPG